MTKVFALLLISLFLLSSQMETAQSQGIDCYDSCSTACVQPDTRLMTRCDRKCQIRCGPNKGKVNDLS
ncbi:hypothetical protein ACHQM5_013772 [Ranunculus cassubicifolius]